MAEAHVTYDDLIDLLPEGPIVVVCGRLDDAREWQKLLGSNRCLAVPLDAAPLFPPRAFAGATEQVAWQHQLTACLDQPGWLTGQADAFDPRREAALLFADPLDPTHTGTRPSFGRREPFLRLLENKTVIDPIWDAIGIPRAQSIVADTPADFAQLGLMVDEGTGVVCAIQSQGGVPSAGGDGIYWWRGQPSAQFDVAAKDVRVRLMPLLAGLPARIHGLVTTREVVTFPPLEVVAPARADHGTFLCAGAVPTLGDHARLRDATEQAGEALRRTLGYRGAFSIDGILTSDGFRPTDLNARLTSAMEAAPSMLRVRLQLANLLAREGAELDPHLVRTLANQAFNAQSTYTLYGAASRASDRPRDVLVRWRGQRLVVAYDHQIHGRLAITPSLRGWLLTATLDREHVPAGAPLNTLAPQVFAMSDAILGTDFGELAVPEGLPGAVHPHDRTAQAVQSRDKA
jgi:hypothetical protein